MTKISGTVRACAFIAAAATPVAIAWGLTQQTQTAPTTQRYQVSGVQPVAGGSQVTVVVIDTFTGDVWYRNSTDRNWAGLGRPRE